MRACDGGGGRVGKGPWWWVWKDTDDVDVKDDDGVKDDGVKIDGGVDDNEWWSWQLFITIQWL